MREIKFRVWDEKHHQWDTSPINFYPNELAVKQGRVIQQFTGVKDKNGRDVYDGDIVSFKYTVGDFAWESMDDEARDINKEMMGKPYICNVVWCELNCGFMMVDGSVESSHIRFPMLYAKTGKVIGNIFENPKL
jgi:uncharacterized phage protein (TIGR01671 family)